MFYQLRRQEHDVNFEFKDQTTHNVNVVFIIFVISDNNNCERIDETST